MNVKLPTVGIDEDGNPILVSRIKFTPEELAWITADAKPNEIAYLDNCVIEFLERELAKSKARRRWLKSQEVTK